MSEFALVIAQQNTHLYKLGLGGVSLVAVAGEQDDMAAWLEQHFPLRAYCSLVNDIMDESYIQSNLPPIWLPSTRQQLIDRRLIQQLRDTPFRAAVCAPSGSWRPPTRVSLVGMGQSERIGLWISALGTRQARLKGLWPLSVLVALALDKKTTPSAKKIAVPPTLALIATPAGLRQVLVRGQTPLFSRLALTAHDGALSAAIVLAEARRTVQYLITQNWLSNDEAPITTQMWLAQQSADDEQAVVEASNDPTLALPTIRTVPDSYSALLPQLKHTSAQLQFLPDSYRTSWRATLIARNARLIGFAALVFAGLWSGAVVWEALDKRSTAQQQVLRAASIDKQARLEVQQAKGDLSQAGLAVATVQAWQQSIQAQPDQLEALQHLAKGLAAVPTVAVQSLRWELAVLPTASSPPEPIACPKTYAAWGVAPDAQAPAAAPAASATDSAVAKPVLALLRISTLLPNDISQRRAIEMQDLLRSKLEGGTWAAYITQSTITPDVSVPQLGVAGELAERKVDFCLQKTAP
jgi:hypothetical protein